jgi:hypothetical protein
MTYRRRIHELTKRDSCSWNDGHKEPSTIRKAVIFGMIPNDSAPRYGNVVVVVGKPGVIVVIGFPKTAEQILQASRFLSLVSFSL